MIHSIHAAEMRDALDAPPYILYGFGGSEHDYSEVTFPGQLNNCTGCHLEGTYYPTRDDVEFRWATTTDTGPLLASPVDDVNTTTNTLVCGVCHAGDFGASHMQDEGGSFAAQQDNDGTINFIVGPTRIETCTNCHKAGNDGDVAVVHGLAPF
jgi:OmcA/MtrC family decaheme c-type cytochrome